MPDLRIADIDAGLLAKLKIAAIKSKKTLRQFVTEKLEHAVKEKP
jgi:predicted HicB family RNase H-like nuclease